MSHSAEAIAAYPDDEFWVTDSQEARIEEAMIKVARTAFDAGRASVQNAHVAGLPMSDSAYRALTGRASNAPTATRDALRAITSEWEYSPAEMVLSLDGLEDRLKTLHMSRGCAGCDACTEMTMLNIAASYFDELSDALLAPGGPIQQVEATHANGGRR